MGPGAGESSLGGSEPTPPPEAPRPLLCAESQAPSQRTPGFLDQGPWKVRLPESLEQSAQNLGAGTQFVTFLLSRNVFTYFYSEDQRVVALGIP